MLRERFRLVFELPRRGNMECTDCRHRALRTGKMESASISLENQVDSQGSAAHIFIGGGHGEVRHSPCVVSHPRKAHPCTESSSSRPASVCPCCSVRRTCQHTAQAVHVDALHLLSKLLDLHPG